MVLLSPAGFPGAASSKEPACPCKRYKSHRLDPWVRKIPQRRAWQPTPVFLPGESPWTEEPGGLPSTGLQSWTRLSNLARTHVSPAHSDFSSGSSIQPEFVKREGIEHPAVTCPGSDACILTAFHWLEPRPMASCNCKRDWETYLAICTRRGNKIRWTVDIYCHRR